MMMSSGFRGIVEPIGERARRAGRYGDTELIHASPRERAVMKRLFGPETRNPKTGLPEHFLGELFSFLGDSASSWGSAAADAASSVGSSIADSASGFGDWASSWFTPSSASDWINPDTGEIFGSAADVGMNDGSLFGGLGNALDLEDAGFGKTMAGGESTGSSGLTGMGLKKALDYAPAARAASRLTSGAKKEPSFFEKYKNPLLLGGGALMLMSLLNQRSKSGGTPAGFAPVASNRAPIDVKLAPRTYTGAPVNGRTYGQGPEGAFYRYAAGGGVSGPGGGRDDRVPAMLSDGEHVIDAETVSLAGDGSNAAGHAQIEKLKRDLRKKKGRALARGRMGPAAGGLAQYMGGR